MEGLRETKVDNYVCRRGKVRDVYELGETMLIIVTTDRVSAFDHVFPNTIQDKGKILQAISCFWAKKLEMPYHLIATDLNQMPEDFREPEFRSRTMLVERAEVIPFECVVRGYLAGSAWKEYQKTGSVCGIPLPPNLRQNQQFPKPIFTPAIKAATGHDENVSFDVMAKEIGVELAAEIEALSVELYTEAAQVAWANGIIIADTKFEWGILPYLNNTVVLIDEVITPDSSRFWPLDAYKLDASIPSFDKQFIRDWAENSGWDKESSPPPLPPDIIEKTRNKYVEAYERLTGEKWARNSLRNTLLS